MSTTSPPRVLSARDLEPILAVAAKLAAPFDLGTMLREVVNAAKQVLDEAAIEYESSWCTGDVTAGIASHVKEHGIDLLVLGRTATARLPAWRSGPWRRSSSHR